jgi:prepilin-type N-terminal cleavage/methylation domain-containing protein
VDAPRPGRDDQGFTIIEVMVSLLLIAVGLAGISTVFMSSLKTSNITAHRVDATALAIRDIEGMRAIPYAELGFSASTPGYSSTFVDGSKTYDTVTVPYSQLSPTPTAVVYRGENFTLTRAIYWADRNRQPGSTYKMTTLLASWNDEVGTHTVRQDAVLYPSGLGVAGSTTTTSVVAGIPNKPDLVSSVNATSPSSAVDLSWTAGAQPPTVSSFKIQSSTNNFATATDVATVSGNVSTYKVSGLAGNTVYQFRVGALNGSQGPTWSNIQTEQTAQGTSTGVCSLLSEKITPSSVSRNASTHALTSTPAVVVTTSGNCSAMSLRYSPSGGGTTITPLTPSAGNTKWTANLNGSLEWDLGNHVVAVWDDIAPAEFSGSSGITVTT